MANQAIGSAMVTKGREILYYEYFLVICSLVIIFLYILYSLGLYVAGLP